MYGLVWGQKRECWGDCILFHTQSFTSGSRAVQKSLWEFTQGNVNPNTLRENYILLLE